MQSNCYTQIYYFLADIFISRKEEERKIRTHRLIEIGAAVESVLGRCIELEEIPKLIAFLNKQEANGKFFSKAMQKDPDMDIKKEECGESGVS